MADLVQSLKLPANWEPIVRQMIDDSNKRRPDPEAERKEIRGMLRLMRENYEHGLYEGEEYQYWQKVNALKEKLDSARAGSRKLPSIEPHIPCWTCVRAGNRPPRRSAKIWCTS